MKKIFISLLALTVIGLLSVERLLAAERAHVNGQVRYGFELKKLTKAEAQAAAQKHYVDLWTYACFDESFVSSGQITLNADGTIRQFKILAGDNTHSYKMVHKDGTEDRTGSVALFARPKNATCTGGGRFNVFDNDISTEYEDAGEVYQSLPHTLIQNSCPTWAYGASSRGGGYYTQQLDASRYCTIIEAEGKKWYCLKMYLVRFEYKDASSFYVTFYKSNPGADGDVSNGASTFNYYSDASAGTYLVWPGQTGDNLDWSQLYTGVNDRYGFIPGGVEVIGGLEAELTAEASCGGSDVPGSFKVTAWGGNDWSKYASVSVEAKNTSGTSSKTLSWGTDIAFDGRAVCNTAGTITATGNATPDEFAYLLHPSGYTLPNGTYADSLLWTFTPKPGTGLQPVVVRTGVKITKVPKLYFAASDASVQNAAVVSGVLLPRPSGVITVSETTKIIGKWTCQPFDAGGSIASTPTMYNCGIGTSPSINQASLWKSDTREGTYSLRAGSSATGSFYSAEHLVGTTGYYYLKADYNGCPVYTDTVQIKVNKPLTPPELIVDTKCGSGLEASADVDADSDPTAWKWAITTAKSGDPTQGTYYYLFTGSSSVNVPNNPNFLDYIDGTQYEPNLSYSTSSSGKNSTLTASLDADALGGKENVQSIMFAIPGSGYYDYFDFLPPSGSMTSPKNLSDCSIAVQCQVNGEWTDWTYQPLANASSGLGSFADFSGFHMGVSATSCAGDVFDAPYCTATDTTVEAGAQVQIRLLIEGQLGFGYFDEEGLPAYDNQSAADLYQNPETPDVVSIFWQYEDKNGKWVTWSKDYEMEPYDANAGLYYFVSPPRAIIEAETHRAIISFNNCMESTMDAPAYAGDVDGDGGNDMVGDEDGGVRFRDIVRISIKSDIITGTIKGKLISELTYKNSPKKMCMPGVLGLKLFDYSPTASLQWQKLVGSTWTDVAGQTTDTYDNVDLFADDDCLYVGCERKFRVKLTEGDDEAFTDEFLVKAFKAKKLNIEVFPTDIAGDPYVINKKLEVTGLCDGTGLAIFPKTDNNPADFDDGSNYGGLGDGIQYVGFQEVVSNNTPLLFSSFAQSSLNPPSGTTEITDGDLGFATLSGLTWHAYRIITGNGDEEGEIGCWAAGDSVIVKKNPKPFLGYCPDKDTCTNSQVTLTITGSTNVDFYQWIIPVRNSNNSNPVSTVPGRLTNSYTDTYPISMENDGAGTYGDYVNVIGWGVFGNKVGNPQSADTIHCPSSALGTPILVSTSLCTTPAPVPNPNPACSGDEITLTWDEDFDASRHTLWDSVPGTGWTKLSAADYTVTKISNPAKFTLKKKYTATGTSATYYKFRINDGEAIGTPSSNLKVNPYPTLSVTDFTIQSGTTDVTDGKVCVGQSVKLSAATGADSYEWYMDAPSASNSAMGSGQDYTLLDGTETADDNDDCTGSYTFYLVVSKTANGCTAKDTLDNPHTLTVNPAPTKPAVLVDNGGPICAGGSHTFVPTVTPPTAAPAGSTYTYSWTPASGSTAGTVAANNQDYTVNTASTDATKTHSYTFKVKVTTGEGCTDSNTATPTLSVIARPTKPVFNPDIADKTVCEGASVSFTPQVNVSTSRQWYKSTTSGGTFAPVAGETALTLEFTSVAGYYKLLVINNNGTCADSTWSAEAHLTVYPKAITPVISDMDAVNFCQGETGKSLTAEVTSAAQTPGSSTQNWYLTNTDGTEVGSGSSYTLPATTYNNAGTYTYVYKQVNITDHGCKDSAQKSVAVTVNATPSGTNVTMDDKSFCSNETLSLTAAPTATTGTATKYEWFKGDAATGTSEGTTPTATYTPTGITAPTTASPVSTQKYTVKVTFGANGCEATATATATVTVVKKPEPITITFNPTSATVCEGEPINISGTVTPPSNGTYTYSWTPSAPGGATDASISIASAQKSDGKEYTLNVKAQHGDATTKVCTATQTKKITLTVNDKPTVSSITITGDDDYCTHDNKTANSISLTANASPATASGVTVTYEWFKDAAPIQSGASNTYTKTAATAEAGSYTVKVTYAKGSCSDAMTSEAKTVAVTQTPSITNAAIEPETESICAGDPFEFAASANITPSVTPTYQWKKGGTNLSGATSDKYGKTTGTNNAADNGEYSVVITAVNKTAKNKECKAWEEPKATLTVTDLPDLGSVTVTSSADKACTSLTLTATAYKQTSSTTAITSGVNYQWKRYNGADWEDIPSATGKTYTVNTVGAGQKYRCVASMGVSGSTCGKSVTSGEKEITVLAQPAITSVTVSPTSTLCAGSDITFTATVDPATPNAGTYSYAWKKGATALSEATASLALNNITTADAATYTCTVTATNDICTASKSNSATLTVTEPINLKNIAIKDSKADSCIDKGDHSLSVTGVPSLPSGATPTYIWTRPDGSTATGATLSVPAQLSNSGTYKVVVVVAPVTSNPCTSKDSATINIRFKFCAEEPLKPGNVTGQGDNIAFVCQNDAATNGAWVEYTPQANSEVASITKVSWYKRAANFTSGVTGGTQIGSDITPAFTWPLKLTQQQVFGNENAPKHYYVRAQIERTQNGVTSVTYSSIYRFARVENAPKVTGLAVTPTDDTICLTGSSASETFTASNANLPAPTGYGSWGITAKVAGTNGVTYMWKWNTATSFDAAAESKTKTVTVNGVVNQAPATVKAVSGYLYELGSTQQICRDTTSEAVGKVTTTQPPVIASFKDGDNATSKTICASMAASDYPTLTVSAPRGTVVKWERKEGTGTYADMGLAEGTTSHQLTAADVATLPAAGAANKTFTYRVTVKNGSKCAEVNAEYTLTVVSMPDLASATVAGNTTAPEFEFCNTGSITAKPKKSGNVDYSGTPAPTYKWEKSATGADDSWTSTGVTNASQPLSAPDNNYYRCMVTVNKTLNSVSCPVEVTAGPVQVTVSAGSDKGTSAIDKTAICNSQTAAFSVSGHTGDITKIEISNANTFPAASTVTVTPGSTPYTIDPSSTTPDIAGLLSTSSRKTTLYVRATVQSGGVCGAVTGDVKTVDVYKPAPKIVIGAIADMCGNTTISSSATPAAGKYSPAIESSFEQIVWTYYNKIDNTTNPTLSYATLAPKYNQDTVYTITATVTNTKLANGVCGPTVSDPVTFHVKRAAQIPAKSNDTTLCEGGTYKVSARRPASGALVWKKGGADLPAAETVVVNGNTETITVSNAVAGTYTYTVSDVTDCGQQDATVKVTVNQKPVAGTISVPAGTNGDFCSGTNVQVTADAGSYTLPTGGSISWQVCTDKNNYTGTRQTSLESGSGASYSKSSNLFTAGTTYYIRYGISGPTCETEYSDWVAVKVIQKPAVSGFAVSSGNNTHICVGTEVTLTVSGKANLKYEIFSNTANNTTGGTSLTSGNLGTAGTASYAVTPAATTYYYAKVTDTSYHGSGACGLSDPSTVMTVNVDPKNVGGKLVFTNTDIAGQPTDNGKKLQGNVGEHTAQLRLSDAVGTDKKLNGMSDKGIAVPATNINPTASLALSTDHMDKTLLWVVVSGGACPDAYSDTVELTVKVGTVPTLSVTSICQGSASTMNINVPAAIQNQNLIITDLEYHKVGVSTWTPVNDAIFGNITGMAPNLKMAVTESLTATLDSGSYIFRFKYKLGNDGTETESPEALLHVDAPSVGGTLASTLDTVCQGGTGPKLTLSGQTGSIQGTYFGTTNTAFPTSASTSKDNNDLYDVPTSDLSRSGYYRVTVKNGECPEAYSTVKEVRVIPTPVAGTLSTGIACFDSPDGITLTLSGNTGGIIVWKTKTSASANDSYTDVPNSNQTTYQPTRLTNHVFVKTAVTTHAVCSPVESTPVEVLVYDTLAFTKHPSEQSVVVGNDVKLEAMVNNSGLKYDNGTGSAFESNMPATYQWQLLSESGTWSDISASNTHFSGAATAQLTIKAAYAETYVGRYFRCVATDAHCHKAIASDSATIKLFAKLDPGQTHSLTACECYYGTDPATYYVSGAEGQGPLTFVWQVSIDNIEWQSVEDVFKEDLASVCKGYTTDTIVFFEIGKLYDDKGVRFIRAWVSDTVTKEGEKTTGKSIDVCVERTKPVYTFVGNVVCEREAAGNVVGFEYTANPTSIQDREITYKYILHANTARTVDGIITNGSSINFGGKTLSFAIDGNDNLTIPASSAVPFDADSMVIRMEVRSCYTPAPDRNTDTTIDVLLRVDKAPELTLLRDTIVCKGSDLTLTARALAANTTIPGNEITLQITPGSLPQTTPVAAVNTLDYLIENIQSITTYTATAKTSYCPEKTATATVTVREIPELSGYRAEPVCVGESLEFQASVTNYDVSTCSIHWLKRKQDGNWDTLGTGLTYTKNNIKEEDAGEYALLMKVTVPSCVDEVLRPFDFKVGVTPQIELAPAPYPGNIMVVKTKDVKVTAKSKSLEEMGYSAALIPYLYLVPVSEYEWYIQKNGEGNFEKLDGTNHTSLINSAINEDTITFNGIEDYDSTLFYAKALTLCDEAETQKDTLKVTDKFTITNVKSTKDLLCNNDDEAAFVIEVRTSLPPRGGWGWQVSTNGGNSWSVVNDGAVPGQSPATYEITPPTPADSMGFALTIKQPTLGMNTWLYRAWATDGTDYDTTTRLNNAVKPQVIPAPAFTCADDNQVLYNPEPVVVLGGSPAVSSFSANCLPVTGTPDPGYEYSYWVRKPGDVEDSTQKQTGSTYDFTPEDGKGIYQVFFVVENKCGNVTAQDSVQVVENLLPKDITAIATMKPGAEPDDPSNKEPKGPEANDFEVEICEGNTLYLAATYEGGPAESFTWQIGNTNIDVTQPPYSLRGDTLVISPVSHNDINGKKFRCLFNLPGGLTPVPSYTITVYVDRKPYVADVKVEITDMTNTAEDLESGQALPEATVQLSVNAPADYTQICFYQAFVHEEGENIQIVVDSVREIHCGTELTYELTTYATVAEHDNTWYYAQIHNECGYDSTRPYQLRVFEDLKVVWIPDTMFERPSGEKVNIDSIYPNPEPGDLVILYLPPTEEGEDTLQVEAHLWVCQNGMFEVNDTTRTGFMNPQYGEEKDENAQDEYYHYSRWYYRAPGEKGWTVFSPTEDPWYSEIMAYEGEISWTVNEHKGTFGFTMPPTGYNLDGYEFRAVGENARYADTTCIITLHVIPSLEPGSLEMVPPQITACNEADAEFKVSSQTADLSKLTLDWQVKPVGADDWSENIDSLHNDTIYTIGKVGLPYNGYEVRAIAQGACGNDTTYGKIIINTPVAPGVKLLGDTTVCLGEPLLLTAVDTGQAGHSAFAWYVNGELVPGETGETFDMGSYEAGNYTVKVVMTADLAAHECVLPETAEAEVSVVVNPLPQVDAHIKDPEIKTGATTEVWATSDGGYTYAWTPEGYVANPKDSATAIGPFEHAGKYTFTVTATSEFGCEASDSVELNVLSNFRLDSIPTATVTPPILPNDEGTLPGFPDDSYPFFGEGVTVIDSVVFYEDEAHLWVCPGNEVRIAIATSGGEKPIKYNWSRVDGNAYPHDEAGILIGWNATGASTQDYVIEDSVIVFFFPDSSTHQFNCHITEGAGSELDIRVYVHYFVPERIYIETRPKTTSTRYYEDQAVYFHARPQRYPEYYWIRLAGPEEDLQITDTRLSAEAMYPTSFKMEHPDETNNQIWVCAIDRHGCRIWDSTSVQLMKLPNVMVIGDPNRPYDDVIFPEFEVEVTNMWGLRIKAFRDRNGNGSTRGWDGCMPSGVRVTAGTYYYKVKIPTLDGFVYMSGAVTVINR